MTGPTVSVLLTTYNRPNWLDRAIQSVLSQSFEDWELLVLDDNSDDPAQFEVMLPYLRRPDVVFFKSGVRHQERLALCRPSVLINVGYQLARGKYVTYLCDDDYYLPQRLERMVRRLERGDCEVVYGSQRVETPEGEELEVRAASAVLEHPGMVVDHNSVMHTRLAGVEVGGWEARPWPEDPIYWLCPDAMFFELLAAAGHRFYPVPEVLDVHLQHDDAVTAKALRRGRVRFPPVQLLARLPPELREVALESWG